MYYNYIYIYYNIDFKNQNDEVMEENNRIQE